MKKIALLAAAFTLGLAAQAQTMNIVTGHVVTAVAASADAMTYTDDGTRLTVCGKTFGVDEISRIYIDESAVDSVSVSVDYDGEAATVTVSGDVARYVSATVDGKHVTIVQSAEVGDDTCGEITYSLSGNSSDGEFTLEGSYKTTIELRGLSLTNPSGAALNILNGKRVTISVKNGTENTLADGAGGSHKAALYVKGHAEFKGKGTLNIYGNTAHGIFTKEYFEMKNCTVNVLSAVKDGVNCNQHFLQESGSLTIKGVGDDGIQVSYKDDTDRSADDTGDFTFNGGTIDITTTANGAKGIKAEHDAHIGGGTLAVAQSGKPTTDGTDFSHVASVKSGHDISVTGGQITIRNSAAGGRGLTADGTVTIDQTQAEVATEVSITVSGNGGTDAEQTDAPSGTGTASSYKVYVSAPASGGGGGPGGGGPGGGGGSNAWKNIYLYSSDGTLVAQLTSSVTKTSGYTSRTFYVYDFKEAQTGTYYFKSDDYTGGGFGWGGSTTYSIQSSTFSAPTSGSDVYYTMSSSYTTSGTTRTYTLTNATSTWSGASSGSSSADSYTPKGIKADTRVALNAGTIQVTATGTGGKGIKSSGTYTQGTSSGNGPSLYVKTSGSALNGNSGGGGGFGGGFGGPGGNSSGGGGSAKAIKAAGTATLYGGTTEVYTSTDGAEGLESKTSVDIQGGQHYFQCYDDCINSSGNIYFNGGVTVCYSNGNDAVDSNAGRTGAITIGNGAVLAYTSKGSPEEGLDCDNNSYIQITGNGIAVSAGGSQGGGFGGSSSSISGASQGYTFLTNSLSYQTGRYYTLADSSGKNLLTYSLAANVSSSLSLITATGMTSGQSYTLKYSASAPTDATTAFHGMYLGSSAAGTTSLTSFTAK